MILLGIIWLALLIIELTRGLPPALQAVGGIIWVIFIFDFIAEFMLAPAKLQYLKKNWLTLLGLLLPALRIFRIIRVARLAALARVGRGARIIRMTSSFSRAMKALRKSLHSKGILYVAILTLIVTLLGAAGMLAFEKDISDQAGIHNYATALWWTAMMLTTMGSQYWPQSTEGRILSLLLATYAFAIFGYITASVASFFVGREKKKPKGSVDPLALSAELKALRQALERIHPEISIDEVIDEVKTTDKSAKSNESEPT